MHQFESGAKPDILFLDMLMPGRNGLDCLIDIRAKPNLKNLPIVALSGSLSPKHIHLAYHSGANIFFAKPASLPDLAEGLSALFKLDWHDPAAITKSHFVKDNFVSFTV